MMAYGMGGGMPPPGQDGEQRIPKPTRLRQWPAYLCRLIGSFFRRLFYIIALVWETSPAILIAMALLCLASGVMPLWGALISRELINEVARLLGVGAAGALPAEGNFLQALFADRVFRTVLWLLLWQLIYQLAQRIVSRVSATVNSLAGELVINHIKVKIMNKAKTVDLCSFDSPAFYARLENANREAGMRPLGILRATFDIISSVISAASFFVILSAVHPAAPFVMVVVALPAAVINYHYRNRNFRYMRHRSKERRQMEYYSGLLVNKDMAGEIRIMGLADTLIGRYKAVFRRYFAGIRRLLTREAVAQVTAGLITQLIYLGLFAFVILRTVYEGAQIGDYSLYIGAVSAISSCVSTIVTASASIYEGTLFIDNMMSFMAEPVTVVALPEHAGEAPLRPVRHAPHTIVFEDVSFRYPGGSRDVISGLNLTLKTGQSTVLVGLNGAGKTTLIKLLTRLYDPTGGRILLDGIDLRRYDVCALYELFGIIFQNFGKYAASVSDNIAFGDIAREATEEGVTAAAVSSNADPFIRALPEGYETPLMRYFEENGIELSIGQWQKLSIARAFYKDSDILVLDEPTASLDPLAEQEVFSQFARLGENKITVFVSHRLSSATVADQVIVLENGQIVEEGNHESLMAQHGKYYTLFSTQARHYISHRDDPPPPPPEDRAHGEIFAGN